MKIEFGFPRKEEEKTKEEGGDHVPCMWSNSVRRGRNKPGLGKEKIKGGSKEEDYDHGT